MDNFFRKFVTNPKSNFISKNNAFLVTEISTQYPLLKILKFVTKTFMLSDFEINLFAHIIQVTNFNF